MVGYNQQLNINNLISAIIITVIMVMFFHLANRMLFLEERKHPGLWGKMGQLPETKPVSKVGELQYLIAEKRPAVIPPRLRAEEFIYILKESESTYNELMAKLPPNKQRRVGQLFEILEDTNHLRRAIQEQRVPLEPFQLLEMELRIASELGYITEANLRLYQTAVLGIEDLMAEGQFSAASRELTKLETVIAKRILQDFDITTKTTFLKIVENMRKATPKEVLRRRY